jgi:tRNA A37 threonylcarbamoyladenosine synthetase subunit TsaC/SUA5/YrdC
VKAIVQEMNRPILSTSVHDDDNFTEYMTDPSLIHEKYIKTVDAIIDGGYGKIEASTVVDCTSGDAVVVREGIEVLK